jgi:hypothetical protein
MTAKELLGSTEDARYVDVNMAVALLANNRFAEAIVEAKAAIPEFSADSGRIGQLPWLALIAAESENGQDADAKSDLQRFLATPRSLRTIAEIQSTTIRPTFRNFLRVCAAPACRQAADSDEFGRRFRSKPATCSD